MALARIDSAQFGPSSFVVCALGDLDAQSDVLRERLMPLADIDGARLVLDVGGAYGLGEEASAVIAEVTRRLDMRGAKRLVIVAGNPWMKEALSNAGFDASAHIETTLNGGLAHASA